MPTALIIGITGQDGSYLAELLLEKGYEVHGMIRRASTPNLGRLTGVLDRIKLHYGDLSDSSSLSPLLARVHPEEIYNLGAMSDVGISFQVPEYSADVTGMGTIRLLEAAHQVLGTDARIYQASSSEMFGSSPPPQNELTPFHPRSPYGCAKVFSYNATVNYREAYGMHASNGILFNHESPRRGENFVTRKITKAVARILRGEQKELLLGNLGARRDWGFAGDYVEAMWRMLQQPSPGDFVIATGEAHSVREFAEEAFTQVGLKWDDYVRTDPSFFRPAEVEHLLGDPRKAKKELGWEPKVSFSALVKMMVEADL
jgi:GDPmannose 4,6-dehydratase